MFPPQLASTGTVVALLGVGAPFANQRTGPPNGFVPQGPPRTYPEVTLCHKPLSVDAEKSSDEAPPTPTCCKNKDSPQAILSVSAEMLVTQPLEEL